MEKTLGQIHIDAYEAGPTGEKGAHAIAAVARHIIDEAMAKHEKECHRLRPPTVKVDDDEPAKPVSPTSGTINTGPIIACDVKQEAASKAGDWAIDAYHKARKSDTIHDAAAIIREAAERHYGKQIDMLKAVISAGKESSRIEHAKRLADQLDAANDRVKILEAELEQAATRLQKTPLFCDYKAIGLREVGAATEHVCDELDAMTKERDAQPSPSADATGDDELRNIVLEVLEPHWTTASNAPGRIASGIVVAIQPKFDALRRERDDAASDRDVWKRSYLEMTEGEPAKNQQRLMDKAVDDCAKLRQRAEAAEAALVELREAVDNCAIYLTYTSRGVDGRSWKVVPNPGDSACEYSAAPTDAILAAYRATKATPVAEGTVKP